MIGMNNLHTKALEREILATDKYGEKIVWLAKMNRLPLRQVQRLVRMEVARGNAHRFK